MVVCGSNSEKDKKKARSSLGSTSLGTSSKDSLTVAKDKTKRLSPSPSAVSLDLKGVEGPELDVNDRQWDVIARKTKEAMGKQQSEFGSMPYDY